MVSTLSSKTIGEKEVDKTPIGGHEEEGNYEG
jgi:hypothetical protein